MLTAAHIDELATLESAHAADRIRMKARQENEREELLGQQAQERKALAERLGLAAAGTETRR